jgi:hypothetical protein
VIVKDPPCHGTEDPSRSCGLTPLAPGRIPPYRGVVAYWLSIEVFDGAFPAVAWRDAHQHSLVESAITNGASYWEWHVHRWGVVLELAFENEEHRDAFRHLPAVLAALDAVPDPVNGLLVYPGRGGGSGASVPRRPRPAPAAGAVALPEPEEELFLHIAPDPDPEPVVRRASAPEPDPVG